jgi:hypothetical protein
LKNKKVNGGVAGEEEKVAERKLLGAVQGGVAGKRPSYPSPVSNGAVLVFFSFFCKRFDEDSVVVYQAFKKEIAEYAVQNKKFDGCGFYNETRMTWIKVTQISLSCFYSEPFTIDQFPLDDVSEQLGHL